MYFNKDRIDLPKKDLLLFIDFYTPPWLKKVIYLKLLKQQMYLILIKTTYDVVWGDLFHKSHISLS